MDKRLALKNKLNITSSSELKKVEERISKTEIIEMWQNNELENFQSGSVNLLKFIHLRTFNKLYDFAGEIRTVQIAKGNFQFANVQFIDNALAYVESLPNSSLKEIVNKYAEMNVVHPFREGNGRTTRLWLDDMLKRNIGVVVDWNEIDNVEYMNAMIKSTNDTSLLYDLLKHNLTDKIYDRDVFFKGLDTSYYYEDMNEFDSKDMYLESKESIEKINMLNKMNFGYNEIDLT